VDEIDNKAVAALVVAILARLGRAEASEVQELARRITEADVHPRIAHLVSNAYKATVG
jgi:hypothetical protein